MSIFKAYDVRGIYGKELTDEIAYKFGRAFATFFDCKKVVVGRDMRKSSEAIEKNLIKGLTEQGVNVIKIGLSTTPMLYFATAKFGYDAGINVTASHNPAEYNGFKLVYKDAVPISKDNGIYEIRELVREDKFTKPESKGTVSEKEGVLNAYVKNALNFSDFGKIKNFKIVADTGNGMGGIVIPDLMKKIPCTFEHLFPEPDGSFPNHEANPLKHETLKSLQEKVTEQKADLGIALDGDADRVGFVDEKGEIIPHDLVTALIASELLLHEKGAKITYDLRSSRAVAETIEKKGGIAIETRVGHSFIKERMRKENALFGGEVSGHYYLRDNFYVESPFIIMLLLLKLMTETGKSLSELIKPLKKYHATGEINFDVTDRKRAMAEIKKEFPDAEKTYELDGLSVVFADYWFNVRSSNTEPLLRLNLEATTEEKMHEVREKITEIINRLKETEN